MDEGRDGRGKRRVGKAWHVVKIGSWDYGFLCEGRDQWSYITARGLRGLCGNFFHRARNIMHLRYVQP